MRWIPGVNFKKLTKDQKNKLRALLRLRRASPVKEKDGSAAYEAQEKKKPTDDSHR